MELAVTHDVLCHADLESTWVYVAEQYFDHHASWDPAVVDMQPSQPGNVRSGFTGVETRRFLGRQRAGFEITEFIPQRRFALRNTSGPFKLDRAYDFVPENGGTRISFSFRMAPKGPARLLFPLLRRIIARQVRSNIDRLADVVS